MPTFYHHSSPEWDPERWFNTGNGWSRSGEYGEAIRCYSNAIELAPRFTAAWVNRGATKLNIHDDFAGAKADFDVAIKLGCNMAGVYTNRGIVKAILGDSEGAMDDHARSISADASLGTNYAARALTRTRIGDLIGAVQYCRLARQLDPALTRTTILDHFDKLLGTERVEPFRQAFPEDPTK